MMHSIAHILKTVGPLSQKSITAACVRMGSTEAMVPVTPFKLHRLESGPATTAKLTKDDAFRLYRKMQTVRRMETAAANLYKERKIRGFCHLYVGEEAIASGICDVKEADDLVITSYRCHGWTYLTGSSPARILSELTGKRNGNVFGKGGSMHMYNKNFFGGNGIVGAQQALGAGLALSLRYRNKPNITFALYGDGAANQGQLMESLNMCALWKCPCTFICENNCFGMGTPIKRAAACTTYYTRGDYVPGIWVDGMDVLAVREMARFAKEYCKTHGPLVVEASTYRFYGHSMSDPGTSYRTREEVQEVRKKRDPINIFVNKVVSAGLITKDDLKPIDNEIKKMIDNAVKIASSEPLLPVEGLVSDLYHETPAIVVRGATIDENVKQPYARTLDLVKKLGVNLNI